MKKLIATTMMVGALSVPMLANAGSESGLYIGASYGQGSFDNVVVDDTGNGYKLMVGYNFGLVPLIDLAVEADYRDFGDFEGNGAQASFTTFDVFAVGALTVGPLAPFVKLGYTNADGDFEFEDGSVSDSTSDPAYGLGLKFSLSSLSVRAEYEYFDLDEDLDMLSVGFTYTF